MWGVWRFEKDPKGNNTKIPYSVKYNGKARTSEPNDWDSFACSERALKEGKYNGIALCFYNGLCGIDIDGLEGHTADNPEAQNILELFKDTYIESSPSGKGYHILFKCELEKLPTEVLDGKKKLSSQYYSKNPHNKLECYVSGLTNRYFTYTGNMVSANSTVTDQTEQFLYFLEKYMRKEEKKVMDASTINNELLSIMSSAKNGDLFKALYYNGDTTAYGDDNSTADQSLCNILAFYLQGNAEQINTYFRNSALYRPKWERADYRSSTINNAIRKCNGEYYKPKKTNNSHKHNVAVVPGSSSSGSGGDGYVRNPKNGNIIYTAEYLVDYLKSQNRSIRLNVITKEYDIKGFKGENTEFLTGNLSNILWNEMRHIDGLSGATRDNIEATISLIASRNAYNPVIELLNSVTWDGKDRIEELYDILCLEIDDTDSKNIIKKWLMQCICLLHNKIDEPFGAEGVLVLTGEQGIGKTSFFRKLALQPEFFKEGITLNFNDKDTFIQGTSCWIGELGEIESTFKTDVEKLRSFITKGVDEFRLPYGRVSTKSPRRTSYCGTCNSSRFLIDELGNRRYFTVPVYNINLDKLEQFDVLQLWKQIENIVGSDYQKSFRLSREERNAIISRNSEHLKLLKGEEEVKAIIYDARSEENSGYYDWKYMTTSEFRSKHLDLLQCFTAEQIGRVLSKIEREEKRDFPSKKTCGNRMRNLPGAKGSLKRWT